MIVSLEWLNSYLDRPIDADEAERVLTDVGFPIESREQIGDDVQLDVEVTSNRSDVLCHTGVAREIAAATGRGYLEPQIDLPASDGQDINGLTAVDNHALDLCPLYTARLIRGVRVGPSPDWMVRRLEAVGLRSINNVVDVTNYVLYEMMQPLHAFDFNLLHGRRIVVRTAQPGEMFTAIDHTRHELNESMLVIADADRAVAVAGVMGGVDSEVNEQTTDLLLESAWFNPLSIRSTSRALKLASDSSYRFERGVDPAGVDRASRRAAQLIIETAGGSLAEGVIAAGRDVPPPVSITLRPQQCNDLLGYETSPQRMVELLTALGLSPKDEDGVIHCTAPTFRLDLQREVDLIEEVARMEGYDRLEIEPLMHLAIRPPQREVLARDAVRGVLVAHGYHETINFSNVAASHAEPFTAPGESLVNLADERKTAEPSLRPSLLPSLLDCRKTNQDAGNRGVRLFELAHAFAARDGQYREDSRLALLCDADQPELALRELRGAIEELMHVMGHDAAQFRKADHPPSWAKEAGVILLPDRSDQPLGQWGLADENIIKLFDLHTPVVLAELDAVALMANYPPERRAQALPRFPSIERDLSVVVDESVRWRQIEQVVEQIDPPLLDQVRFITTYRGRQTGKGRKSVSFRMAFRDPQKTLRHEEVDPQVEAVMQRLNQELSAEIRTA
jgi:phenylalanyl-tRNA synthetase beta chain